MARSTLFAPEHDESESTEEADPLASGEDPDEDPEEPNPEEQQLMMGAGVASGVLGLFVGGPILAVLVGFGAAYATQKEGAVGDSARAVGEVARTAQFQAQAVDQKHHLWQKSKQAARQAWTRARAMDRQYKILDTTVDLVQFSWKATKDFCQRHRVVERGVEGTKQSLEWIAEQVDQRTTAARSR